MSLLTRIIFTYDISKLDQQRIIEFISQTQLLQFNLYFYKLCICLFVRPIFLFNIISNSRSTYLYLKNNYITTLDCNVVIIGTLFIEQWFSRYSSPDHVVETD